MIAALASALAPALPAPVSTAPGIHVIGPVLPGTPRAMKRAHARQMPSCVLRAVIKDNAMTSAWALPGITTR